MAESGERPTVGAWVFTFGFSHEHPDTGASLANCYVRIAAPDAEAARVEMVRRYGLKWAFQYDDEDKAGVAKYGLREIDAAPSTVGQAESVEPARSPQGEAGQG